MNTAPKGRVVRDALVVGAATGVYGLSFGAIAVSSGFSILQAIVLSAVMFTGASQFSLVTALGAGGSPAAAIATATLLGVRNGLYGIRLAPVLRLRGLARPAGAHLVLDESTAMSLAQPGPEGARLAFWATGLSVFVFWNLATVFGAFGASLVDDPARLGLDGAIPAAFLALLAPRLRERRVMVIAVVAAAAAVLAVPLVPVGAPALAGAGTAVALGSRWGLRE